MSDCIFCKLATGQIETDMVYETDKVAVIKDSSPQAPVHLLIMPKKHIESLDKLEDGDQDILEDIIKAIQKVTRDLGLDEKGYRVVINTGEGGGQTVMHLHFHLLAGREFSWPPG